MRSPHWHANVGHHCPTRAQLPGRPRAAAALLEAAVSLLFGLCPLKLCSNATALSRPVPRSRALLEADVSLPVVRRFVKKVEEAALGERVVKGLSPDQKLVKASHCWDLRCTAWLPCKAWRCLSCIHPSVCVGKSLSPQAAAAA